jgi:hypothetical protein
MTTQRLLRLYPRAWRDRYEDEFLETAGSGPLQLQQVIDIVSGAIDAWLSADVRGATRAAAQDTGGATMVKSVSICEKNQTRYTKRDGLIGAAMIIGGSLLSVLLGTMLKRNGYDSAAESLMSMGWLVAMNLSMPLWLTKGQPRSAQLALTGVTTAILVLAAWLNA